MDVNMARPPLLFDWRQTQRDSCRVHSAFVTSSTHYPDEPQEISTSSAQGTVSSPISVALNRRNAQRLPYKTFVGVNSNA